MMCIMAASVAMYGCSSDDEPNKEEQKRENNENVTPAKARMQLTQGNRIKLWPRQGFHEGNLVKSLHGIDVS